MDDDTQDGGRCRRCHGTGLCAEQAESTSPHLVCTVCGVKVALDDSDAAIILAEVETFCAAHSTHRDGIAVTAELPVVKDDDNGKAAG